jgi:predicted regulator of Ras-like GTPase activity (Roadblock/LC7/MglB family)
VRQFSITTELVTLVVSYITSEYYLLLVLGEGGNYGRARFELRRAQLLLESDLR